LQGDRSKPEIRRLLVRQAYLAVIPGRQSLIITFD
jgi:hypothetical protein